MYHYFRLAQVETRHAYKLDENRPAAVARREATGQRTARANVMDLCDDGSVVGRGRASLLNDLDSCYSAPRLHRSIGHPLIIIFSNKRQVVGGVRLAGHRGAAQAALAAGAHRARVDTPSL